MLALRALRGVPFVLPLHRLREMRFERVPRAVGEVHRVQLSLRMCGATREGLSHPERAVRAASVLRRRSAAFARAGDL